MFTYLYVYSLYRFVEDTFLHVSKKDEEIRCYICLERQQD